MYHGVPGSRAGRAASSSDTHLSPDPASTSAVADRRPPTEQARRMPVAERARTVPAATSRDRRSPTDVRRATAPDDRGRAATSGRYTGTSGRLNSSAVRPVDRCRPPDITTCAGWRGRPQREAQRRPAPGRQTVKNASGCSVPAPATTASAADAAQAFVDAGARRPRRRRAPRDCACRCRLRASGRTRRRSTRRRPARVSKNGPSNAARDQALPIGREAFDGRRRGPSIVPHRARSGADRPSACVAPRARR